jgi:hypothetical protein
MLMEWKRDVVGGRKRTGRAREMWRTASRFEELLTDESSLMGGKLMGDVEDLWEVGEKAYVADVVWTCVERGILEHITTVYMKIS